MTGKFLFVYFLLCVLAVEITGSSSDKKHDKSSPKFNKAYYTTYYVGRRRQTQHALAGLVPGYGSHPSHQIHARHTLPTAKHQRKLHTPSQYASSSKSWKIRHPGHSSHPGSNSHQGKYQKFSFKIKYPHMQTVDKPLTAKLVYRRQAENPPHTTPNPLYTRNNRRSMGRMFGDLLDYS